MSSSTSTPIQVPETCLRQQFAEGLQACESAPQYGIVLTVDPSAAQVVGNQLITFINQVVKALDNTVPRLLPNVPGYGNSMTVTDLLVSEQPILFEAELEGSVPRIPLEPPLEPGRMLTLSIGFSVDVPTSSIPAHGLFSYIHGAMALPKVYPIVPVHDERSWSVDVAPVHGYDVFANVAIYNVEVTGSSGFTLVASGACGPLEKQTRTCEAAAMRDFTMILGENYERATREARGVVVNSYFYEWHESGGMKALDVAVVALEAFSDFFGPYAYTELDVVETPNYLGGMEYSGWLWWRTAYILGSRPLNG